MENGEDISRVIFELSSNRRTSILFAIGKEDLRMQQIAKSLNMTATETFRHLQRLSETKLIEKNSNGTYSITSLGKLATGLLSSFNFFLKNGDYFLEHDVFSLPYEFVNRLGELSAGEFYGETLATLNRSRKMIYEADSYVWAIAEQSESSHTPIVNQKVPKGLKMKFLMQKELAKTIEYEPQLEHLKERRYTERIRLTLLITEKESAVHFRRNNGKMEFTGFFGTDEIFRKWTRDLFMYYWDRAERWYPGILIK